MESSIRARVCLLPHLLMPERPQREEPCTSGEAGLNTGPSAEPSDATA